MTFILLSYVSFVKEEEDIDSQLLADRCSGYKKVHRGSILSQLNTEESLENLNGAVQVMTTLSWAEVEGVPSCVTWATCQVQHDLP